MSQTWNARQYQKTGAFVPKLGEPLITLLDPQLGMRILDLGCGDGTLTLKIMAYGATVLGVDASPAMVEASRSHGVQAILADARLLDFREEFDAVFSNAALHWMTEDPPAVARNVYASLRPGGRFVAEMGGEGNIQVLRRCQQQALQPYGLDLDWIMPKFFPSAAEYRGLLETAGFHVVEMIHFERPTALPDGIAGWIRLFSTGTLEALPPDKREAYLQTVEEAARPLLFNEHGWWADYVRLRFVAVKPA